MLRLRPVPECRAWFAWLVTLTALCSCGPEVERMPPTQTVIRIEAEPRVQAALHELRVRTASPNGDEWFERSNNSFAADVLRWPVDIVVVPHAPLGTNRYFEVVVEALDAGGEVLVQARALTGFVLREQRVLVLPLAACGTTPPWVRV